MTPYYERDGITIFCGECSEVMAGFEPDTFDLTVTSPPYDDLREYNGYVFEFEPIARQLWRITSQGGVVVWVVADATVNGSETLTSFRQALWFMELGFNVETMIYEVAGTGAKGSNYYYWQAFEFMFVFSKGQPKTSNRIADHKNTYAGTFTGSSPKMQKLGSRTEPKNGRRLVPKYSVRTNIWRYQPSNCNDQTIHPAPFPEALARDHIVSWSNPGDLVLDPMCGSGTTLKMAQQLGRRAVGIDISEEYCKIAVERLRQPSFFTIGALNGDDTPAPTQRALFGEAD